MAARPIRNPVSPTLETTEIVSSALPWENGPLALDPLGSTASPTLRSSEYEHGLDACVRIGTPGKQYRSRSTAILFASCVEQVTMMTVGGSTSPAAVSTESLEPSPKKTGCPMDLKAFTRCGSRSRPIHWKPVPNVSNCRRNDATCWPTGPIPHIRAKRPLEFEAKPCTSSSGAVPTPTLGRASRSASFCPAAANTGVKAIDMTTTPVRIFVIGTGRILNVSESVKMTNANSPPPARRQPSCVPSPTVRPNSGEIALTTNAFMLRRPNNSAKLNSHS
mmetsp:Transcript_29780/g.81672  ORF Transcript_29780/g.81672 Transcript_29780/m.81672 type:complete len:277 (+) Transcript_29780:728-1558(+)